MNKPYLELLASQSVRRGRVRTTPMRRFWCYLGALLTLALLCAMAWLLANYHPERKVSEAGLLYSSQPEKGAPARDSFPASGASRRPK